MYVYWNNNPSGIHIGDCAVRAISTALDQPWERTYIDLCVEGFMFSDMPNSNAVIDSLLRSKGFKRYGIPDTCPNCYTIAQFVEDHPQGTFIVATGTHVVCVKDSQIIDNWDSSSQVPTYYYSKE